MEAPTAAAPIPLPPLEPTPPAPPIPSTPLSRRSIPSNSELEAILHAPLPRQRPPQTEQRDERCWMRCRQTNARRALGREPVCTQLCYINMRNHINSLVAVPGSPGTYFAAMSNAGDPSNNASTSTATDDEAKIIKPTPLVESEGPKIPEYHWKGLDGRYFYYARGRELINQHLDEMGGEKWKGIGAIEERCEASRLASEEGEPKTRQARREQLAVRRSLGLNDEENYERLISLSSLYSTSLQRFHTHVFRIYTPLFKNLARLPETFRDGTQLQMAYTLWTKLTDGSALALAERMRKSTVDVARQLRERRANGGGGGEAGGLGGLGGGGTPAS